MPVETRSSPSKIFRSRSRRGCLTCRQHRLKCDEKSPRCGSCARLMRDCKWGLKASFHPSRISQLSSFDSATLSEIESTRQSRNALEFVDETRDIEREYLGPDKSASGNSSSHCIDFHRAKNIPGRQATIPGTHGAVAVRNSASPTPSETTTSNPQSLRNPETLEYLSPATPPIPDPPNYLKSNNISLIRSLPQYSGPSSASVLIWPINEQTKATLLSAYFQEISKWLEAIKPSSSFSSSNQIVSESPCFAAAAVLLASLTNFGKDPTSILLIRELHIFALKTISLLKSEHHGGTLFSTILLCMYYSAMEMVIEEESMLKECVVLLQEATSNSISADIVSACFWTFVIQDIWTSYQNNHQTIIPPSIYYSLYQNSANASEEASYTTDLLQLSAEIVNTLSSSTKATTRTLQTLWTTLQTWIIQRPPCLKSVIEIEASGDSPFPTILFSNKSAVWSNIYYHTASIILLNTGKIKDDFSAIASPTCHARRIIGISITNDDPSNLLSIIHPLSISAHQLPNHIERIVILKHLREIPEKTGYRTQKIVSALENSWDI